jgi:isopentenyl phosphate kinase
MSKIAERFSRLVFLKLGGSLITEKNRPRTARMDTIDRLAQEIASALREAPELKLILGHGAGSYGHVSANKYATRQGVSTPEEWRGFTEVWWDASALNRIVVESLRRTRLPALSLPPSASVIARDGRVESWDLTSLNMALKAGLLPVVFGDVIFDLERGGTILSTEDLFSHLARHLKPDRILLAGIEPGVWADYPHCTRLIKEITPASFPEVEKVLHGSAAIDVTGGMASKVRQSLDLVQELDGLEVSIFSGEVEGLLKRTLLGERSGTTVHK